VQLRINLDGMAFLVAATPNARTDYETKAPKMAEDGRPMFSVTLLVMDGKDSAPVRVSVAGDPGLFQGQFVTPVNLVLNAMERKGEPIQWWTAERLEAAAPPQFGAPTPAGAGAGSAARAGKAAG
jgi:hypothetical protein